MIKVSLNPIGTLGVFKPIQVEGHKQDERDGMHCEIIGASFWIAKDGEKTGELEIQFLNSDEWLTVGLDEFQSL